MISEVVTFDYYPEEIEMGIRNRYTTVAVGLLAASVTGPQLAAQVTSKPILVAGLKPLADARVQGTVSTNFANGDLVLGLPDKVVFIRFPVKDSIPAGAVVIEAQLVMSFRTLSQGTNPVEVGRIQAPWSESTVNATNQPAVSWLGITRSVSPGSTVSFDVKDVVASMLTTPGQGLALRGDGPLMYGYSRETAPSSSQQPTLRIKYLVP